MEKYKREFKLEVVQSVLAGEGGARLLAGRWLVREEKIRTWVSPCRLHGIDRWRPKRSAYSGQFNLRVLAGQDREPLSSRQVAAFYDIGNPHQVVVWRGNLDQGRLQALASEKEERPKMKPERGGAAPSNKLASDAAQTLPRANSLDALEAGVHGDVHYDNPERIKLGLQGLSPVAYRLRSTA
ncbi:hypothetical protein ACFQGW_19710 [Xanthomonas theicola]|uniref:hypothetical protein n=1 Tax=Xanthomonas theicola TaxID=56464 RepID=UPI00163A4D3F|nr:hypothetical protein [Xanthomonas theicola]QNH25359.1 hypothetical protein G4Q83_12270 [Xanthomonas theicola]